ncbi:MAG: NTPase [Paludibacteraceae bacterium]|nr:NTPase [Paludibacteraceae bacterium]
MWSDKETSKDLLGFGVHASLLKSVVTNEKNLPITIGLYGDWGSGKSSVLEILKEQLKDEEGAVVVYFDGWTFESFDDAKIALIQGIVDELESNKKFFSKVGDGLKDLKDDFVKLKDSINWMRVLKVTTQMAIPTAAAFATGGASIIPSIVLALKNSKEDLQNIINEDKLEEFIKSNIAKGEEEKKYQAVREFRSDFEQLIKKSKQGKVVVLIDDLDRCLPRHIIDSLEAIKLFLNVPGTAFVIAADEYIVSNAIKSEYKSLIEASNGENKNREDLGKSYMEKFIQLPYHLPMLSRKEVETYVTLLFCQSFLDPEDFEKIQSDFAKFVVNNKFEKYGWDNIKDIVDESKCAELCETIGFVSHFSSIIGTALRWNPRLIKRFLNAYEIRKSLLEVSGLATQANKFALLKLMLIEQQHVNLFRTLNSWVMSNDGAENKVGALEASVEKNEFSEEYAEWNKPEIKALIEKEPKFSSIDLKELFWVSRDNIIDTMSGTTLIPARVKKLFNECYSASSEPILRNQCEGQIKLLSADDLSDFYSLLEEKTLSNPEDKKCYHIYYFCVMSDVDFAYQKLLEILSRIDIQKIPFSLGNKFKDICTKYGADTKLMTLLEANELLIKTIKTTR